VSFRPKAALRGTIVHWNIAGLAMNSGRPGVAVALAEAVRRLSPAPLAVTVNEVCDRQYELLLAELAPLGFCGAAAWSITDLGRDDVSSYGNVVLWRGGDGGVERWTYPDDLQVDGPATREKRTLLRVTSATLPLRIATTHPHQQSVWAGRQVRYAAEVLGAGFQELPTVVSGDLNLPPRSRALDGWYSDHQEADRLPRFVSVPTHRSFRKLDYVFVPRDRMRVVGCPRRALRFRLSDHVRLTVGVEVSTAS
jgi:endonuclease/exonuclease/phosphatase family metal-dependent hydrolase